MKHYKSIDRANYYKVVAPIPKRYKKLGYDESNSKAWYEVDEYRRIIVLYFQWRNDEPECVKWNQYANHFLGEFTVSDDQQRRFDNQLKRINK